MMIWDWGIVPSPLSFFFASAVTARRAMEEAVSKPRPKRNPTYSRVSANYLQWTSITYGIHLPVARYSVGENIDGQGLYLAH